MRNTLTTACASSESPCLSAALSECLSALRARGEREPTFYLFTSTGTSLPDDGAAPPDAARCDAVGVHTPAGAAAAAAAPRTSAHAVWLPEGAQATAWSAEGDELPSFFADAAQLEDLLRRQPSFVLLGAPDGPLVRLAERLRRVFPAATSVGAMPALSSTRVLALRARGGALERARSVGLALRLPEAARAEARDEARDGDGDGDGGMLVADAARLVREVWGNEMPHDRFLLDGAVAKELFVPRDIAPGAQPLPPAPAPVAYPPEEPPRLLPVFPLDLVVFPGGAAPLRVFEPRYRVLVKAALEAQARGAFDDAAFGLMPASADVGTAVLVEALDALADDGTSELRLRGWRRFARPRFAPGGGDLRPRRDAFGLLEAEVAFFDDDDYGDAGPPPHPSGEAGAARALARELAHRHAVLGPLRPSAFDGDGTEWPLRVDFDGDPNRDVTVSEWSMRAAQHVRDRMQPNQRSLDLQLGWLRETSPLRRLEKIGAFLADTERA